ncbi:Glutamate mutase sigma subunit [subsurface metagenome]
MKDNIFTGLREAMFNYDDKKVKKLTEESIKEGVNPIETVNILTEAIDKIGNRFERGELFLPDLMLGAKAMQEAMDLLKEEIEEKGLKLKTIGKVVIGTVFGDLHNIGKSMVATMLNANGFEVIDLGINIDSKTFIKAIKKNNPDILAMSALLTTTAPEQERVIKALVEEGIRNKIKVMIGGGPITQEFADKIGADGYEPTAQLAVKLAKKLVNK